MIGKKLLTLLSLAMGIAIVGGTFAAWAVTDNADPFGVKVSPGTVGPDTTKFVTLSYGTSTFANVDKLEAGKARLAGSVILKAETNAGEPFPYGQFDVQLLDQSVGKALGDPRLVDLLKVDIYDQTITVNDGVAVIPKKPSSEDPIDPKCSLPTVSYVKDTTVVDALTFAASLAEHSRLFKKVESNYVEIGAYDSGVSEYFYKVNKTKFNMTIPEGGYPVYAVVSLDASTDAMVLEKIAKDVVYLEMELNKADSGDYTTTTPIYVGKEAGSGEKVYCYAWSATNKNAAWPGVEMTAFSSGYYSYELKTDFDKVIFHSAKKNGEEWASSWQTADLSITETIRTTTPTFTPTGTGEDGKWTGTWGSAPNPDIVPGYYVVGDKIGTGKFEPVKDTLMTVDPNDDKHYTKSMTFVAGEKIKVCNQNRTVWFSSVSTWDGCGFTIDGDGNLVVTNAGTYTVNLYTEGDGGNCLTLGLPVKA